MNDPILDQDLISDNQPRQPKTRAVFIWLAVILLSVLFKIMHWPGGTILLILASAGLQAFVLIRLLFSEEKDLWSQLIAVLGATWFAYIVFGALFLNGHPFNDKGLLIYGIVFSIYFIAYYYRLKRQ